MRTQVDKVYRPTRDAFKYAVNAFVFNAECGRDHCSATVQNKPSVRFPHGILAIYTV
jgi:hypothetical protein